MKYNEQTKVSKTSIPVVFRSAGSEDAEAVIDYLKRCCGETRFLLSEPEDVSYTIESEEKFLADFEQSAHSLMLNAYVDGKLAGNASFEPVSTAKRLCHRCSMGIALFQEYCGQGIGELLLEILIEQAQLAGFEMMELDVVTANAGAVHLYRKLGFEIYGERKHAMKYKDGTYADEYLMARKL